MKYWSVTFMFVGICKILFAQQSVQLSAQQIAQQRDTSYTLSSALAKAQQYNKEKDIEITPVYSNPSKKIKTKKEIQYKIITNRSLTANIFYPKMKAKQFFPGVLIIHGGGWRSGDKSLMTPMAEMLAASGYFVMAPEYRLSPEAPYPAAVLDLYDAINWMSDHAEKYNINMGKLIVMGCSAGGQLAALIGTTYNQPTNLYGKEKRGRITAIIDVDGVLAFKHPDSEEGTVAGEWLGGTYEQVPDRWEEASALHHVDQYTPPTLFLASIYPRFLAGRQDYIEKMNMYGTPTETHFMDRAPHSFWLFNPWFTPTMNHILEFLGGTMK